MTTPVVRCCPDGHYHRVVYDISPFIADYPEQVMLSGVVQGWCPKYGSLPSAIATVMLTIVLAQHRCTSKSRDLDGEGGR